MTFFVIISLSCMNSACRNDPVGAQTQVSKASRNTFLHGKRDYYFYAYDNDPSTPETRCWYFKDAKSGTDQIEALSSAQRLVPKEVADERIKSVIRTWQHANTAMALVGTMTARTACTAAVAAAATPLGPVVIAGCVGFTIWGVASTAMDAAKNSQSAQAVASVELGRDQKMDPEIILQIVDAVQNTSSVALGNSCWPANKIINKHKSLFTESGTGGDPSGSIASPPASRMSFCRSYRAQRESIPLFSGEFSDKVIGYVGQTSQSGGRDKPITMWTAGSGKTTDRLYVKVQGPSTMDGLSGWAKFADISCQH